MIRSFLGLTFSEKELDEWVSEILRPDLQTSSRGIHCINSFSITEAWKAEELLKIFQEDYLICDGKPLSKVLKNREIQIPNLRGPSLMREVIRSSPPSVRHFFLGGSPETLVALVVKVKELNPQLTISGYYSPPFSPNPYVDYSTWVDTLQRADADVIWVGLGTPKQDYLVSTLSKELPGTFIAVGAAFDFLAGSVPEAPQIFQNSGFEWIYRLYREPKRLWRRYFTSNLLFLYLAFRYRILNQSLR